MLRAYSIGAPIGAGQISRDKYYGSFFGRVLLSYTMLIPNLLGFRLVLIILHVSDSELKCNITIIHFMSDWYILIQVKTDCMARYEFRIQQFTLELVKKNSSNMLYFAHFISSSRNFNISRQVPDTAPAEIQSVLS